MYVGEKIWEHLGVYSSQKRIFVQLKFVDSHYICE